MSFVGGRAESGERMCDEVGGRCIGLVMMIGIGEMTREAGTCGVGGLMRIP